MSTKPVALVTGASHGFGERTAEALARDGYRVFAGMRRIDRSNAAAAWRTRTLARDERLSLEPIELDVTDDESVAQAVDAILADAGRIDVVVNNAGVLYWGITEAFTVEQVGEQLDVNVLGVARLNRAVLPGMRKRGSGVLVHVSSIGGRLTFPFYGIYCASKYAVEALATAYRYELSAFGVDSVIVEPGPFPTNLLAAQVDPADRARVAAYGRVNETATGLRAGLDELLASADAPDPQQVAEAIVELVDTRPGRRPLRTVVGLDFGTAAINEATEPHQNYALESWQVGHMASIAEVPAAVGEART